MTDILHFLNLREAYRTGIIDRAEFVRLHTARNAEELIPKQPTCNGCERIYEDGSGYICRHCGVDIGDEDFSDV